MLVITDRSKDGRQRSLGARVKFWRNLNCDICRSVRRRVNVESHRTYFRLGDNRSVADDLLTPLGGSVKCRCRVDLTIMSLVTGNGGAVHRV